MWKAIPVCVSVAMVLGWSGLQAKPVPDKKEATKEGKSPAFKPVEINNEITANDPNDPKLEKPAKKYTVKLEKDKTYILDLVSTDKDFDPYLRVLDKNGNELAEDDDGGGDLNSRLLFSPKESGDHQVIAATLDGQFGKFRLKIREFAIKGEAKARDLGKDGISVTDTINQNTTTEIGKLGKVFSVAVKAGQSYTINVDSGTMDSYLYLFDAKSKLVAQDDDSGGDLNSQIVYRATQNGVIHIIATTLDGDETGEFTLRVRKSD